MPDPLFGEQGVCSPNSRTARRWTRRPCGASPGPGACPRNCCRSSGSSTSCRARRAERSPKADFATSSDRHWRSRDSREVRKVAWGCGHPPSCRRSASTSPTSSRWRWPSATLAVSRVRREHGRAHHPGSPTGAVTCTSTRGGCGGRAHRVGHLRRRRGPVRGARALGCPRHPHLHRDPPPPARDARVVIHNHPYYVQPHRGARHPSLGWCTRPARCSSTTCLVECDGEIDPGAAELAAIGWFGQPGDLAQPRRDRHRRISRRRSTGGVHRTGVPAGLRCDGHRPHPTTMNRGDMVGMQASLIERAADVYWAGAPG